MRLWTLSLVALSGCFQARYLTQAAVGQYELLHKAVPISQVQRDAHVPLRTRFLLASVERMKDYAKAQGLEATRNYRRYTPLDRDAAVYVVQGCSALSFEVRRWSFPLVGAVPYLGFFDEAEARRYAVQVEAEEHLDVTVREAQAYSTLGWFEDPVLSTMLGDGDASLGSLADTVLHESTHATIYVPNQTTFNESLASFVGDELSVEWLGHALGTRSREAAVWRSALRRGAARGARLRAAFLELDALFKSTVDDEAKRREKARIYEALRVELGHAHALNNAGLAGYQAYGADRAPFEALKATCGSWARTLAALKTLRADDFEQAHAEHFGPMLDALAQRACVKR